MMAIATKQPSELTDEDRKAKEQLEAYHRQCEDEAAEEKRRREVEAAKASATYGQRLRMSEEQAGTKSLAMFMQVMKERYKPISRIRLPCTAAEAEKYLQAAYTGQVHRRCMALNADDNTRAVIREASKWLTEDKKPCLLLRGYVGVGKTTLMYAIRDVVQFLLGRSMTIVEARRVAAKISESPSELERLEKQELLGIDDLGTEPVVVKNYGNEMSPLAELISARYAERRFTVITTNLTVVREKDGGTETDELFRTYGDRVFDRIKEVCNTIFYDGEQQSYRK